MPKVAVSVTLDQDNLLWLRGRTAGKKRRSMSEVLDEVVTAARRSGQPAGAARSVVGTLDIAADDPLLERADTLVRQSFDASLGVNDAAAEPRRARDVKRKPRRG